MSRIRLMLVLVVAVGLQANFVQGSLADGGVRYARVSGGNGWSGREVRQAIRFTVHEWHVPGGAHKALSVARCESHFNERDRNSCCSGVFQQNRRYWDGRRRRYNPHHGWKLQPSVYNARTNITISVIMAHRTGWGDWSCA